MTRSRLALVLAVAALLAVAVLLGGALRGSSGAQAGGAPSPAVASAFTAGFSLNQSTAGIVDDLQTELRAEPDNARGYALLGLAYEQRARETGDPTYYTKAGGVLKHALRLAPRDLVATGGLGSLALSRHRFAEALAIGRRARALSPTTASSYGIIGDALVELGRYREAFRAFDTMARLKPSLSAYARVAYARELNGHTAAAISAMKLAVDAALNQQEPTGRTGSSASSTGRTAISPPPSASTAPRSPCSPATCTPSTLWRRPRLRAAISPVQSRWRGRQSPSFRCRSSSRPSAICTRSRAGGSSPRCSTG